MDDVLTLIALGSETRRTEFKEWFNPFDSEGITKITKGCLALYNSNGGYFIVGVSDDGAIQGLEESDARVANFNLERIQEIVNKYSSVKFEIEICKHNVESGVIISIGVPTGVTTPAVCKKDLEDGPKKFLRKNQIYYRTYNANNKISSTEIQYQDWDLMLSGIIHNRESTFAEFLSRHFRNNLENIELARAHLTNRKPIFEEMSLFREIFMQKCAGENIPIANYGYAEYFGIIHNDDIDPTPNQLKIFQMLSINPNLTGFPLWGNTFALNNRLPKPYVLNESWISWINLFASNLFTRLDYWAIKNNSMFYSVRILQEDVPNRTTIFDPIIMTLRIIEAITVLQAYANFTKTTDLNPAITFGIRVNGLFGREIGQVEFMRYVQPFYGESQTNTVSAIVTLKANDAGDNMTDAVYEIMRKICAIFSGGEIPKPLIQEYTKAFFARQI